MIEFANDILGAKFAITNLAAAPTVKPSQKSGKNNAAACDGCLSITAVRTKYCDNCRASFCGAFVSQSDSALSDLCDGQFHRFAESATHVRRPIQRKENKCRECTTPAAVDCKTCKFMFCGKKHAHSENRVQRLTVEVGMDFL